MRTLIVFTVAGGLLAVGPRTAAAQHDHHADPAGAPAAQSSGQQMKGMMGKGQMGKGMMGQGQMQQMMNDPLHRSLMAAFVLPEMQSELGLSTQQIAQLREMKQTMLANVKTFNSRIEAKQKELDALLTVVEPATTDVRTRMSELATLTADRQFAVFEAAVKMKALLSVEQRSKLDALKPGEIHEIMMQRVPMDEHRVFMSMFMNMP